MDVKEAGSSLDSLVSSFNSRIAELQELVIARNMYPTRSITDLSAVDSTLKAMELQVQQIKDRLREETQAIPKAKVKVRKYMKREAEMLELSDWVLKKLIEASLKQQKKLQNMCVYAPTYLRERSTVTHQDTSICPLTEASKQDFAFGTLKREEETAPLPKDKKGRASPPLWYITANELESLSSYMRGRLTLDKVNAAITDMASYAEANAHLITAPRKKLTEGVLEKALELREIGMADGVKGKHFFLETDIKGPSLKLDNTGKAILTVLRHLGRISESRIGHHRVFILLRPL